MKILHLNAARTMGGGEVHTHDLCRKLVQRGYDVVLACRTRGALHEKCLATGLRCIDLPFRGILDLSSAYRLAAYCRAHGVTILHAHVGRDYVTALWVSLLYPSVKIVLTRHVIFPFGNSMVHRLLIKRTERIIAVSSAVKSVLLSNGQIPEQKIRIIHNGIDLDVYGNRDPHYTRFAGCTIGMIGQIAPNKGQEVLIRSVPAVVAAFPRARFIIAGSSFKDHDYASGLVRLCRDLDVAGNVEFQGYSDDVAGLMNRLRILTLCSEKEAFGLVVVEAMACGTPVITADCGGVADIVEDGENGLIVPPGNPRQLAEAIIRLLSDTDLCRYLAENGRKTVRARFDLETMATATAELYRELC